MNDSCIAVGILLVMVFIGFMVVIVTWDDLPSGEELDEWWEDFSDEPNRDD